MSMRGGKWYPSEGPRSHRQRRQSCSATQRLRNALLGGLAAVLLAGCAGGGGSAASGFGEAHDRWVRSLPAEWRGRLHCVDCAGVDYRLLLRPDGTYFQRQAFPLGSQSDDIGRWYVSSDGAVLWLAGNRDSDDRFAINSGDALTKLDRAGRPLRGPHNFTIRRQAPTALQPELSMQGRYVFTAGNATFEECRSGLVMAVTPGPQAAALERAYLDDRVGMRAPLLVSVRGRVQTAGRAPALEVQGFEGTFPGLDCPPRAAPAPLLGTRWQLVSLNAEPVLNMPGEVGLYIQLQRGGELRGSSGCDDFKARWSQRGDRITVDQLAPPRNSCPGDAVLLMTFGEALTAARSWRQIGDTFELYGANGALLAGFKALR